MKRASLSLIFIVTLLACAEAAPIRLSEPETAITDQCEFWLNAPPGLSVSDVASPSANGGFSLVEGRQTWVGKGAPVSWFRFTLEDGHAIENGNAIGGQNLYLEVRPSFSIILDHAELYIPREGGGFDSYRAGDLESRSAGYIPSRYILFALPRAALGRTCYLRVSSRMDVEIHLKAWTGMALARSEGLELAAFGIIFGILLAMVLYNFFLFTSLHDRTYLLYSLYVIFASLWLFLLQGHSRNLLGPMPGLDRPLLWLFAGFMIDAACCFASSFLRLRNSRQVLFVLLMADGALAALGGALGLAGLQHCAFSITNATGGIACLLIMTAAFARAAQGYGPARYFLVAWITLGLGGALFILMDLKLLSVGFWTKNGLSLGFAAESILLSLALADRFKSLERDRLRLERSQAKLRMLSLTDELTGLYNKRYLMSELRKSVAAAHDQGEALSAILLDLDDFKSINDNHGHGFGDGILVALASSIRSCIREGDKPCRFGGEEFVILMPGLREDAAFGVAERIRERFAAEGRAIQGGEALHATVSLGVAELRATEEAPAFLDRVDGAMYEAKRLGKNRTVMN